MNNITNIEDFNAILIDILFEKRKNKKLLAIDNELELYSKINKEKSKKENIHINSKYNHNDYKHNRENYDNKNNITDIAIDIKCDNCNSRNIKEMDGYNVCTNCGLFNDCIIDSTQEWRFYGSSDNKTSDPSRCDIPTNDLLPKTSIGSLVGFGTRENKTSKRIRNMNYWNAITYRESSLLETFNNITIMAQNSGISQCIIEEAKYMYKQVTDVKSSRRTKKEAMKAGSIMLACKLKGVPRNCDEISQIFKLKNNKTFRKSVKTFEEIWNNMQNSEKHVKTKKHNTKKNKNKHNESDESESDESNDTDDSEDEEDYNSDELSDSDETIVNETDIIDSKTVDTKIIDTISNNQTKITDIKIDCEDDIEDDSEEDSEDDSDNDTKTEFTTKKNTNSIKKTSKKTQECITKLHRFSCILGLNEKVFEACRTILIYIENQKYLDKHTPLSRTSAIIYYVIERLEISINKNQILQTCAVSQVTINKCYQKMMKYKKELEAIDI